ncbi:MAG: hypothetical protein ACK4OM_05365 [Alphaproteobacteria bacterium]
MPNNSIHLSIASYNYYQNIDSNEIKSKINNFDKYSVNIISISCEYDVGAYPEIEITGDSSLE